jgi:SOS-response transcriptional repressor LexA
MPREPLTPAQLSVLLFILGFRRRYRLSPSLRDICMHFNFESPNSAVCHLEPLEKKGYIRNMRFKARCIVPTVRFVSLAELGLDD